MSQRSTATEPTNSTSHPLRLDPARASLSVLVLAALSLAAIGQTPTAPSATTNPAPNGTVLFERTTPPPNAEDPSASPAKPTPTQPAAADTLAVTEAERSALTFTTYDLDLHLNPATAALSARADITLRNDSPNPLPRLILQLSSTLHWDAITAHTAATSQPIPFTTHQVDTDADHTGSMTEAVLTLPHPLAPGASVTLTTLYSGTIPPSAQRLTRIGAPEDQALAADWDAIAPPDPDDITGGTALRGFGNVLWYPVSASPALLGDGAKLFQSVGATRLRESAATIRLRLAVAYLGDPPDAAFFCGHRAHLTALPDDPALPAAESPGIATALFAPQPLGFRTPSLFITASAPTVTGPTDDTTLLAAVTSHYDALPSWSAAAALVTPLLTDWFGPQPLTQLTLIDHPGQPFEDDALLVRPIHAAADPATLAPDLIHSLTHAWIHSTHPWIDEGLAQFATLLWIEHTSGRPAALAQLQQDDRQLALVEPETPPSEPTSTSSSSSSSANPSELSPIEPPTPHTPSTAPAGVGGTPTPPTPTISPAGLNLPSATGELFYRTKAAAVWWQLRALVGDVALKQALKTYRLDPKLDADPTGLEHTLEQASHKDLRWFFDDWVYRDRGLPDLSIESVTPSQISSTSGLPAGWLVAVTVHNDGYATADVPVTVRSADSTQTQRLRIPGHSSRSTRIVFAGTPGQVEVNDGSVPETQSSLHTRTLVLTK